MEFVNAAKRIGDIFEVEDEYVGNTYLLDFNNGTITTIGEARFLDVLDAYNEEPGYYVVKDVG